jgi:2-dehydropantoate 2-reductase
MTPDAPAMPGSQPPRGRILVVGGGAVGSFLGTLLALEGYELTLVRPFGPGRGVGPIALVRPDGSRHSVVVNRVLRVEDAEEPDFMLVGVKMPILREALAPTLRWPLVPTLTVQNGIGAEEIAAEIRPDAPRLAGSLTAPIELAPEDEVRWLGRGGIGLAAVNEPARPWVRRLVGDFARAGLRAAELPDARAMKWSKLLANLLANAGGAILDMDAAAIYADRRLFEVEKAQLREAVAVMAGLGLRPVNLPRASVVWLARGARLPSWAVRPLATRIVGGARGSKLPSLRLLMRSLGDGVATEPTEAVWMNGAIARHGSRLGLATPVNARLAELVEDVALHPDRREWLRHNPERFLAEMAAPAAGGSAAGGNAAGGNAAGGNAAAS